MEDSREARLSVQIRDWVLDCGARYWGDGREHLARLTLLNSFASSSQHALTDAAAIDPGAFVFVQLPDWAADCGVDSAIGVDAAAIFDGEGPAWRRCDWLLAAFLQLGGTIERRHERCHGPIGSYAFRLGASADPKRFEHAWVNRMFLFLRRAASRERDGDEEKLFGHLPQPQIVLTHDIDALRKTIEIRAKAAAFSFWNAGRKLREGQLAAAPSHVMHGIRFGLGPGNFDTLDEVRELEEKAGLRSVLHVYGGRAGFRRGFPQSMLIDPAYDVNGPRIRQQLRAFIDGGWEIGLHQSYGAWEDAAKMRAERERVEQTSGRPVTHCRQHWHRFSWHGTWAAQEAAGLRLDSTLGFNDRPGFRNGAALKLHPWNPEAGNAMSIAAMPMVFMDSQFYDYQPMTDDERGDAMQGWLDEVRAVHGQATVSWHTHTISDSYGWGFGFRQLIGLLA
ncbi:MAG: hypothetical protein AAGC70_08185 [Pseudomonadota bacterium]